MIFCGHQRHETTHGPSQNQILVLESFVVVDLITLWFCFHFYLSIYNWILS